MEIKTSKGVNYVNADYTIEEKQGEYPKLTCTIPASKNKIWIDDCKELDRLYTPGEQDEFVIINPVKITKGDSYDLEITAVGAFEFDFVKSRINDNLPTRSYTVEYLLDLVFKDTRYSYDLQGTYEKREFTNFGSDNRYKLFLQIMNRFNLEFKIIGKIVRVNSKIGNDTGFQFRYLKNIKDTKYSVDATNLVTHVKGYGAYHDANDQSKGRLEVEYLSPLSDIYGKLSGEPVVDERMSISATLLEKCKQSVESSVAVTVSTTLVALKNQEYRGIARVGDSIWFIDERIELEKKIRFSTVKSYYDAFDELIKQDVQLGDKDVFSRAQSSDSASQSKLIDKQKELSDQLADVEDAIKKTYVMPSGVNRVFYSSDLPEDVPKGTIKEGDTLFRNIDGETKMYRWDGVQWELVPVVNDVEKFREELDNEIAQVNQSMQAQSEEHDRQVADILSKTQSVESLANQAKSDAASALARANQAKTEAIADARAQVATVSQALNTAKTELQTAIASADQKARDSQASATVLRNDLNLQASKILAQAQAQTALTSRVTTVENLADGTKTTVAELSKTVSKATGDITSVTSRTKIVEDTLSQTRAQYEALTQTVNTQTGQIDSINRKTADLQSGIDGVTERFENLRVGGRNLIPGSKTFSGSHWEKEGTWRLEESLYKGAGVLTWVSGKKTSPLGRITVQAGEIYTFSAYIKKENLGTVYFYLYDSNNIQYATADAPRETLIRNVGDSFQRFTITFKVTRSGILRPRFAIPDADTGGFSVAGYQLENGSLASNYIEAPEDIHSEIATYKRTVEESSTELTRRIQLADGKAVEAKTYAQQTAEGFKTRLESLETYKNEEGTRASQYLTASRTETARQITAERTSISANYVAKSTYTEDARGTTQRLNEIKSTADTAKQNLATYQETVDRKLEELTSSTQTLDGKINTASSKVDTVAGQIRTEISEVEGKIPTEIGGRNLFKGSRDFSGVWHNASNGSFFEEYKGVHIHRTKTAWLGKSQRISVKSGEIYTFSFYAKSDSENDRIVFYLSHSSTGTPAQGHPNNKYIAISTDYQRYSITIKIASDGIIVPRLEKTNTTGFLFFGGFKLETGAIATDWSPAPEDINDELSSVKTTITQTASGVEQLSTSLATTDNKVTTAEANIRNLVDEVSSKVSQTDYNTLTGRVENTETAITQNAQEISKRLTKIQVNQAILADKKIKDTRGDNQNPQWYWTNYPRQTVEEFKSSAVIGLTGESAYAVLTTNVQWDDSSGGKVKQTAKTYRATFERYGAGTTWEAWTKIANAGDLANYTTKTEFQTVLETTSLYERTIGAVGEAGSILDNISKVTQTAAGLVQEVSGTNGLKTQVSTLAGSYAMKSLTSSGDVLNQLNLNKDGSVKIDGKLVQITGKTYIENGVIKEAMIGDLSAGKITSGTLDAARIKANSIDGSKIAFDQAFFNGLTANEAYLKQLFAKNAFITQVQAVSLSAEQVTSGILQATNKAVKIDLNNANITFNQNATINFNSDSNALVRKKGDVTAFINFADDSVSGGVYAGFGVTSHAVGVTTADNSDRGKFAGMRVYRPNDSLDLLRLIGDTIELRHGTEGKYFYFKPSQLRNNVDMLKLAGAVYTLSRIFMHLSANGWAFDHPSFIAGVKDEMARNWLQDFANGGLPR